MKINEDYIERTLNALEDITRAAPPSNFEQLLSNRLRMAQRWQKWIQYSAAALVVFSLINVFTLLRVESTSDDYEAFTDYFMSNSAPVINFTEDE